MTAFSLMAMNSPHNASISQRSTPTRSTSPYTRFAATVLGVVIAGLISGCGSTTARLGTEQLLLSDAVDEAVQQVDFSALAGTRVYLDTRYVIGKDSKSIVGSDYVISSLRQQLLISGAFVQEQRDDADLIVEPRVGALGTDGHDVVYGMPQAGAIGTAAAALSGSAVPIIPEISIGHSDAQSGIAKIVVFAYDRETRQPVWQSGVAKAESNSSSTWFLGAGPFQKGTIHDGYRFAGREFGNAHSANGDAAETNEPESARVKYDQAWTFPQSLTDQHATSSEPAGGSDGLEAGDKNPVKQVSHQEPSR